ncbi:unnamed protein product [Danaus chrysippus]|uniref:(African queen) hypothetical protein n=1 Tax=Danaus chrysippus TaxID=151541 RepID=A0A8J2QIS9_9NEOP|nr:unnamed protein product [Danaus chrysippus]
MEEEISNALQACSQLNDKLNITINKEKRQRRHHDFKYYALRIDANSKQENNQYNHERRNTSSENDKKIFNDSGIDFSRYPYGGIEEDLINSVNRQTIDDDGKYNLKRHKRSKRNEPLLSKDDIDKQLLEQTEETGDESFYTEGSSSLGDSTFVPVRAGETTDSDDQSPRAVRFNKVAEVRVMSAAMAGEALLARLSWSASLRATEYAQRRAAAAATRRHLRLALVFCVPWFISNYLYRLSLLHTTSCSTTLYTSTTGAFALSFGAMFSQVPTDRFSTSKCISVLLTAACLVVLGISESHHNNWIAVLTAIGSAFCYSLHLLLFRQELRKGDGINSFLLVGVVGCACGCLAWIAGGLLAAGGVERADLPSPRLWSWLLLDAALGPLLIESLWLWGRWLTSSQTATASLACIFPLCVCVEAWRGNGSVWRGVAAVLAAGSWVLATIPGHTPLGWITARIRTDGFTAIRNISDLDEQSEALMSSDEPT